jgi:hypothetical protein
MTALIRIDRSLTPATSSDRKAIRFCSRCGHPSEQPPAKESQRFPRERVCGRCGMGLMLSCSRDALPGDAAAFAVVTFDLRISAVSVAGEKFFGTEQSLVGTPLLDVLTSPLGDDQLALHAGQAAQRACEPVVMPVRLTFPVGGHVGTLAARIATCGPPRAALITVEPSDFGKR